MNSRRQTALQAQPEIIRSKQIFGVVYGVVVGLTFAVSVWGMDGYLLSRARAYLPWLNFVIALFLCAAIGTIAGWLTARYDNSVVGVAFWFAAAILFARLVIILPLQITPQLISIWNPPLGRLFDYPNTEIGLRFGIALMWIAPFTLVTGVAQIPISESAVFSTSIFGKAAPLFFCVLVMGMGGAAADGLVNEHFRGAITAMDNTIQFVLDHQNDPHADPARARAMHAGSLNTVREYLSESRSLFVSSYDESFGEIHVLVQFESQWADCTVIYNQPVFCKAIDKK